MTTASDIFDDHADKCGWSPEDRLNALDNLGVNPWDVLYDALDEYYNLDDTDSGEREVLTSELLGQLRYWESCLEGVITMESKK